MCVYVHMCVCAVEVHYCVVKLQWKFISSKCSINFNRVQNVSIRRSSSASIACVYVRACVRVPVYVYMCVHACFCVCIVQVC